jgi:radical SAM protein with 4Fe4S-binding SPASM domain
MQLIGTVDDPVENEETWSRAVVRGWVLPPDKVSHVNISIEGTIVCTCPLGSELRPDLAEAYSYVPSAENGGFNTVISIGDREGIYEISVSAVGLDGEQCSLGKRRIVNSRTPNGMPSEYAIGLISRCNLSCVMCPAHAEDSKFLTEGLAIDQSLLEASLQGLRDFASSIKFVALCGWGEPLMYPKIFEVIEQVHETSPSAVISITSNGTMFSDVIIQKILSSSLSEICVSLDAGTKMTFDRIRKGANFNRVIEGTRRLVAARTEHNRRLPVVLTNFVLLRSNISELPDYVKTAIMMNVDHINTVHVHGLYESDRQQTLYDLGDASSELPPVLSNYIQQAKALAKSAKVGLFIPPFTPSHPKLNCSFRGRSYPTIDPNGDVYPCCILEALGNEQGSRVKAIGNIRHEKLHQIWNSPRYRAFRRAFYAGELPDPYCAKCPRYYNL